MGVEIPRVADGQPPRVLISNPIRPDGSLATTVTYATSFGPNDRADYRSCSMERWLEMVEEGLARTGSARL